MADFLQQYNLSPGVSIPIDTSTAACIAYDFTNNSPYNIAVQWGLGKPTALSVAPTTIWRGAQPSSQLLIPGNQWTGIIIATPSLPPGASAPSGVAAQLTVHGYAKGSEPVEQIVPLNTLTNIGTPVPTVGLTNFFDVKNPLYGAKGDGVSDDTAAFLSAISAAQAAGGGVVYVPASLPYIVHLFANPNVPSLQAAIHLPSNVTLWGDGPGASIIKLANGAAVDQQQMVMNWNPQASGADSAIRIQDICINGNSANQTPGVNLSMCNGIAFFFARYIFLTNVHVKNHIGTTGGANGPSGLTGESHAILIKQSADVGIDNCHAYTDDGGQTGSGICFSESMDLNISNCTARHLTHGGGFPSFQCNHLKEVNCHAYDLVSNGFQYEQDNYCEATNCVAGALSPVMQADSIPASTSYSTSGGFSSQSCKHMFFTNCIAINCTSDGFETKIAVSDPGVPCTDVLYTGCLAVLGSANGWNILDTSADIDFANCASRANTGIGFWIQSTDTTGRFLFVGCSAESNNIGYEADASPAVGTMRLQNCQALNNTTTALKIAGTSYSRLDGHIGADPAVPASTTALTNPFPFPMSVTVSGGTVTVIAVDGTTTGITSGSVRVPVGKSITLTYTVAPTWVWIAD